MRIRFLLLPLLILVVLAGCKKPGEEATLSEDLTKTMDVIPVEAEYPIRQDMSEILKPSGTIIAERHVDVIAKGTGLCLEVFVEEGDRVQESQVLAQLETDDIKAQIAQSAVQVEQQRIALKRARELKGIVSGNSVEDAQLALQGAQKALEAQQLQLKHQTIKAPISGRVTLRNLHKGMMVSQGTPVFKILDPDSFLLPLELPEQYLPSLKIGQEAKVTLDSAPNQVFTARIRRIRPGTLQTKGFVLPLLEFGDDALPYLREGATAIVELYIDTKTNVLTIPKECISQERAEYYVMVLREEKPENMQEVELNLDRITGPVYYSEKVAVELGLQNENRREVLSGLDEQTLVVTVGNYKLRSMKPGTPVYVTTAQDALDASADHAKEAAAETSPQAE